MAELVVASDDWLADRTLAEVELDETALPGAAPARSAAAERGSLWVRAR